MHPSRVNIAGGNVLSEQAVGVVMHYHAIARSINTFNHESTLLMESSLTERANWRDYYELCKPNVVWLMILTAIVGMCMATPGIVPVDVVIFASTGIALCAGSAAAINHLADQHVDAVMARTSGRPIVKGKIDSQGAAVFAFVLGSLGMVVLSTWVNALTAWLTLASLVGYAFIYTLYLKRATPQNIVIGGLAGAMPPLLGWTAVTNQV